MKRRGDERELGAFGGAPSDLYEQKRQKLRGVKRLEKLNFIRNYLQWTDLSTHTPRQGRNDKNVGKQNATPHPSELFLNFKIRKEAKRRRKKH